MCVFVISSLSFHFLVFSMFLILSNSTALTIVMRFSFFCNKFVLLRSLFCFAGLFV